MPGMFQNFIAGRQAGQAEQDRGRAIDQQELQNQLLQRQQAMAEQEFAQRQGVFTREQQFNQLAANYLGGDTVQSLGVPTTGGPPAQAVDESQGPPQYPQSAPSAPQGGGQPPISQLIGLDPARALELEKVRAQRVQQQQQKIYSLVTSVMNSPKPAAAFKYVLGADMIGDLNIKQFREGLQEQGVDIDKLDDEQASSILQAIAARSRAAAGIAPEADFTLAQGAQRFTGDGRLIASVPAGPTANDPADKTFARANTLRDEYNKKTQDFEKVASAYGKVLSHTNDPSPAGDLGLIFGFMKMLDPVSSVREGEQAQAANTGSIPERVWGLYNRVVTGERLAESVRRDFQHQAENVYKSEGTQYAKQRKNYANLAIRAKVDPANVLGDNLYTDGASGSPSRDYSSVSDDDLRKQLGLPKDAAP